MRAAAAAIGGAAAGEVAHEPAGACSSGCECRGQRELEVEVAAAGGELGEQGGDVSLEVLPGHGETYR